VSLPRILSSPIQSRSPPATGGSATPPVQPAARIPGWPSRRARAETMEIPSPARPKGSRCLRSPRSPRGHLDGFFASRPAASRHRCRPWLRSRGSASWASVAPDGLGGTRCPSGRAANGSPSGHTFSCRNGRPGSPRLPRQRKAKRRRPPNRGSPISVTRC